MKPAFAIYRPLDGQYSGGFEQLLRQEKAIYSLVHEKSDEAVICFEGCFPDWAYGYVEDGGIAIVSGADKNTFSFDAGFAARAAVEYIDLADFGEGKARISSTICAFIGEGRGTLTLHENRTIKQGRRPGFYPVFLYRQYGKGTIIYSGVHFARLLTLEGSDLRRTNELIDFDERITSIDKCKLASALRQVLREAMHLADYPCISLWYFPDGAPSLFAYSIDGDGLLSEGLDNLIEVSQTTDTKFLFYINRELCGNDPEVREKLKRIAETNLLGSHGSIHNAKDSYEDNLEDLKDVEEWAKSLGSALDRTYAAPRGMYSHNLGRALKECGYRHSRDFGFSLDDYPYFPAWEGEFDTPLQIPCDGFNVCRLIGIHEEKGLEKPTAEEIIGFYRTLIDEKAQKHLPMLFFCHPQYFGLYAKEVYPAIVDCAKEKGALLSDYVSYGDFWLARDESSYTVKEEDGKITVNVIKKDPRVRFCADGKILNIDEGDSLTL